MSANIQPTFIKCALNVKRIDETINLFNFEKDFYCKKWELKNERD